MEPLRDPTFILGDSVPWSLVFSLILLAFGLGLLFYVLYKNKREEGCLIGSKTGEKYGITTFIGDTKDEKPKFDKWNMMCKIYPENYPKADENNKVESEKEVDEKEIEK